MSAISVAQQRISFMEFKATREEGEIANYAIQSYGFVLKGNPFGQKNHYSWDEFADKIVEVFDCNSPQTAAVLTALRSIHQRNPQLH